MPLSNLALVSVSQGLPQTAPLNCKDTGGICIGAPCTGANVVPIATWPPSQSRARCSAACDVTAVAPNLMSLSERLDSSSSGGRCQYDAHQWPAGSVLAMKVSCVMPAVMVCGLSARQEWLAGALRNPAVEPGLSRASSAQSPRTWFQHRRRVAAS